MSGSPQPWRHLRDLEPPLGSKRRVMDAAFDAIESRAQRVWPRRMILAGAAVGLAAVTLWLATHRDHGGLSTARRARPADPIERLAAPELSVQEDDRFSIRLSHGDAVVSGPAAVTVKPEGLWIREGRVEIAGYAVVYGGKCAATIEGRARAEIISEALVVTVFEGTAHASALPCAIRYQAELMLRDAPRTIGETGALATENGAEVPMERVANALPSGPAVPTGPREAVSPPKTRDRAHKDIKEIGVALSGQPLRDNPAGPAAGNLPSPSPLRRQLDALKRARALFASDSTLGLRALEEFVEAWPESALREEVDADMVRVLLELGQHDRARAKMRSFHERFPESPRSQQFRAWDKVEGKK